MLKQARRRDLLSDEHFTVDGTLLEAWAGQKSFRRRDDDQQPPAASGEEGGSNPTVNFHGEKRSNDTQQGIEVRQRHGGRIDLLLTDVVMPGMNGRNMGNRILEILPKPRVVFVSGYAGHAFTALLPETEI